MEADKNVVYKWIVKINGEDQEIGSGKVLHVASQGDPSEIVVWTEETPTSRELGYKRPVRVYGTGDEVEGIYLGSVVGLVFVWHLYAKN